MPTAGEYKHEPSGVPCNCFVKRRIRLTCCMKSCLRSETSHSPSPSSTNRSTKSKKVTFNPVLSVRDYDSNTTSEINQHEHHFDPEYFAEHMKIQSDPPSPFDDHELLDFNRRFPLPVEQYEATAAVKQTSHEIVWNGLDISSELIDFSCDFGDTSIVTESVDESSCTLQQKQQVMNETNCEVSNDSKSESNEAGIQLNEIYSSAKRVYDFEKYSQSILYNDDESEEQCTDEEVEPLKCSTAGFNVDEGTQYDFQESEYLCNCSLTSLCCELSSEDELGDDQHPWENYYSRHSARKPFFKLLYSRQFLHNTSVVLFWIGCTFLAILLYTFLFVCSDEQSSSCSTLVDNLET